MKTMLDISSTMRRKTSHLQKEYVTGQTTNENDSTDHLGIEVIETKKKISFGESWKKDFDKVSLLHKILKSSLITDQNLNQISRPSNLVNL